MSERRAGRCTWIVTVVVGLLVVIAIGSGVLGTSVSGGDAPAWSPCADRAAEQHGCMTATAPPGWRRVYGEDFGVAVPVGGFTNREPDDWRLVESNPYATSLRSYPDGWGTTDDLSLNFASKTTDVVADEFGAHGVLRTYAHSQRVGEQTRSLAASFFTVIDPEAASEADKVGRIHGRYSVRFRTVGGSASRGSGFGSSFLLWPVDDRWRNGEINFPEMAWGDAIGGFVHKIGDPAVNAAAFTSASSSDSGWHVATIEWSAGELVFVLDGVVVARVDHDIPEVAMRFGVQSGGDSAEPASEVDGYLLIDWITVDEPGPTALATDASTDATTGSAPRRRDRDRSDP